MSLRNIFGQTKYVERPQEEVAPVAQAATTVDNAEKEKIVHIDYGTGMPIDAVYAFVKRDNKTMGYNDALSNWDNAYKEMRISMIRNELKQLFNQVKLRYVGELKILEMQIKIANSQCMLTTSASLETDRSLINDHLKEIEVMEEKLEKDDPEMMVMIKSYEMGFMLGVTAKMNNVGGNVITEG